MDRKTALRASAAVAALVAIAIYFGTKQVLTTRPAGNPPAAKFDPPPAPSRVVPAVPAPGPISTPTPEAPPQQPTAQLKMVSAPVMAPPAVSPQQASAPQSQPESAPLPADAAVSQQQMPAARAIGIQAGINDIARFDVTAIEVSAGERIAITLTNRGTAPKSAMGHNWVLLAQGTDPTTFSLAAAGAAATDFIPPAMSGAILAHTRVLGPGESDSVTFTAPRTPGEYTYLCSFSVHFMLGMKGTLIVK